jgi:hypothetical protein
LAAVAEDAEAVFLARQWVKVLTEVRVAVALAETQLVLDFNQHLILQILQFLRNMEMPAEATPVPIRLGRLAEVLEVRVL